MKIDLEVESLSEIPSRFTGVVEYPDIPGLIDKG
jgi:hypothetical protein